VAPAGGMRASHRHYREIADLRVAHALHCTAHMKIFALAACVIVTGCVADEGDESELGGGGGKADGGAVVLAPTYGLELVSAMKMEDRRETDPAKRNYTLTMRARAQVKTEVTATGAKLTVKICDVRLPQVSGYQPELDAAFVASLPALTVNATTGTQLTTDPSALVLGAALAKPLTDPLPAAGSTRIKDQDQDGNPGVSIRIPGYGSIFAAMRVTLDLDAPLTSAATIAGTAEVGLDQKLYGDDIWFYDAVTSAADTEANVKLVSATNTFKMKRDATTCAKVRAQFP
jgi:hypothetical protein